MAERPIPFSAPMVRAILAGTKTQTRRAVKEPGWASPDSLHLFNGRPWAADPLKGDRDLPCPYGQPGDRLWVREAWRATREFDGVKPSDLRAPADGLLGTPIVHEATRHESVRFGKLRPGMFMPRWASRITLEVVGVRVERLTAISEADAIAEGIERGASDGFWKLYGSGTNGDMDRSPRVAYRSLWESINGPGSWALHPWVWVVEFRRV